MKNVLYLSPSVTMYGARVMLLQLASALDPARFRPVAVCLTEGGLTDELRRRNIPAYVVGIHPWRKGKNLWRIPVNTVRIANIIKREKIDIIHCNDFWALPWALAARWWAGSAAPVICHVRNPVGEKRVRNYKLQQADKIVTISHALRAELDHWSKVMQDEKIVTIHDGLDFSLLDAQKDTCDLRKKLNIPSESQIILQVGHISERKDQLTLLRAVQKLPESFKPHVIFLGDVKPHNREFGEEVKRLGESPQLAGRVHFAGFQAEVAPYYRMCDLLAIPSAEEGLGLVSLEAMHFAKPVVGSNTGGIPEVVKDGETGLLHPPGDAAALSKVVETLLNDVETMRSFGLAGQVRAHEMFSLSTHADNMQNLYDRISGSERSH
jgi:glycosyltransferase involved in cell wall biosynthesis